MPHERGLRPTHGRHSRRERRLPPEQKEPMLGDTGNGKHEDHRLGEYKDSDAQLSCRTRPIYNAGATDPVSSGYYPVCGCIKCTRDFHPGSTIQLFGEISSIRGVQRIFRAETPFIRILWILFVVSMTCLLTISSFMLIVDYLQYTTSWHTRTLPGDEADFPAITLCAHNPFSLKANLLWSTREVITPSQVKALMAAISLEMLQQNHSTQSAEFALNDSFQFYYTNLEPEDSQKISHDFGIIPHCIIQQTDHDWVAENCLMEETTPLIRRIFSHPKYFNCLTIEGGDEKNTSGINRLVLLAHLVPSKQIEEAKSAFVMDTFTRGEGIKVVIHERNAYPEIEKYGFNVQPNRMNEIIYETISWKRLSTPVAPCKDTQPPISDLGFNYTYEMSACVDTAVQLELIRRCGCMVSEWPRPIQATSGPQQVPYCTTMNRSSSVQLAARVVVNRYACLSQFFEELPMIRERVVQSRLCLPRCRFFTYDTKLSVTSWEPSPTKLSAYTHIFRQVDRFILEPNETNKEALRDFLRSMIGQNSSNTSEQRGSGRQTGNYAQFSDGTYTYISLVRREVDTTLKEERLVFDAHILLSRIGGLCSLCIGLTMAFFIEIIEFIYAVFHTKSGKYSTDQSRHHSPNMTEVMRNRCIPQSSPNPTIPSDSLPTGVNLPTDEHKPEPENECHPDQREGNPPENEVKSRSKSITIC